MMDDLFVDPDPVPVAQAAWLLRGYLRESAPQIIESVRGVLHQSPLRTMQVPGGKWMSVKTSSCGALGWVSDALGYRYADTDPLTGQPWPAMPTALQVLARDAAAEVGFGAFEPDVCLINCYKPGAKMGLHQDRDEKDLSAPIVSVSLGLPAVFMFGGYTRSDAVKRFALEHGDVLVWGGVSRMVYHGVAPLKAGHHPLLGEWRVNLTFRRAG